MATFYGTVKGNRETAATRTGSKDSGIRASVQSYKGSVITTLTERSDGTLMVDVEVNEQKSSFYGTKVFYGTFEEYKEVLLNAWNNNDNRPIEF